MDSIVWWKFNLRGRNSSVGTIIFIQARIHSSPFFLHIRSLFFLGKAFCSMNLFFHLQLEPVLTVPGTKATVTHTYSRRGPWLYTATTITFRVVVIKLALCESDLTSAKSYKCAIKLICGRIVRKFFLPYFSIFISVCIIVKFLIEKCK